MYTQKIEKQFLAAYDQYADALYRYCYFRIGNNKPIAEDLVQETFTNCWHYLTKGNSIKNIRAFLYQTARNAIIDRSRKKQTSDSSLETLQELGFDPVDHNAESIETTVECQRLMETMEQLDETDKDLLVLRFIEGYGPKDIAEMLHETQNTISVRINRAKKRLSQLYVPKSSS